MIKSLLKFICCSLVVGLCFPVLTYAQTPVSSASMEVLMKKITELEQKVKKVEYLETEIKRLKSKIGSEGFVTGGVVVSDEDEYKGNLPGFGGIYNEPNLRRFGKKTYLGGYIDMEYIDDEDSNARFRQHRLVPFIYADISERVKFAAEIEIEDGGPQNNQGDGQIKVEFAAIDYLINDKINFRTGILLSPLGKFNLVHDSPLRDLTNRPLVNRFIIPTTLSEAGAGFYGTFYPTELSKLDYEAYVVNGFTGITAAGTANFSQAGGFRAGRGSQRSDVNDNPAFVGKLTYSPFLGLETGFSTHVGDYDARGTNMLAIYAWDLTYQRGPFELLFEAAYADAQLEALAKALGIPDEGWGYYIQGNYHFMPNFLKEKFPEFFTDESTFTFSTRWDQVDVVGRGRERFTVGLNFRPTEDTVFKLSSEWNLEDKRLNNVANNEIQASVATYF